MSRHGVTPELTIGHGAKWGLAVVVLMLAGMAVGGVAVHNFVNARGYYLPAAVALLLMVLACALAAVKTDEEKAEKE